MKVIPLFVLLFFVCIAPLRAQQQEWTIRFTDGIELEHASLMTLKGDSLLVVLSGKQSVFPIAEVSKISWREANSKAINSAIGGLGLGAGTGYMLGLIVSANNSQSSNSYSSSKSNNSDTKAIFAVGGGVLGIIIGTALGVSAQTHSYDLENYGLEEKRRFIFSLMPQGERLTQVQTRQRNIVYLKNGSMIKGIIVELIPDSIIKIQTFDSSLFVFKMNEVEKVTKDESSVSVLSNALAVDSIVSKNSKPSSFAAKGTTELGGSFSYQSVTPIANGSGGNSINIFQIEPFIGQFVSDEFELGLNPFGISSLGSGGASVTEVLILGSASYHIRTESKSFPFLEGLLGYSSVSASGGGSASGISWGLRGGIKHSITDKGLLNLSLEYLQITANPDGATKRNGSDQFSIAIGFTVWF